MFYVIIFNHAIIFIQNRYKISYFHKMLIYYLLFIGIGAQNSLWLQKKRYPNYYK
jgi:hypothetical protein